MGYRYINLDYLEKMAAGDPEARQEMLRMLIAELESSGPRLKMLRETQNQAELQWLCHHLKSTFPFVGNEQLANANRELEHHLRQGQILAGLAPLFLEIETLLPKALKELRQELEKS